MIVACRGCKRGVSTDAAVCPHCGTPDPYHGWAPPIPSRAAAEPAPPPPPRPRRAPRALPRRGGTPLAGLAAVAVIAAMVLGAGFFLYKLKGTPPPPARNDGYPVGQAPRAEAQRPATDRLGRLEGQYLTGVGDVISEERLKRDNPAIERLLLHEREDCPLLKAAMKYHLPLYVTVKGGRFVGDTDGKVYSTHKLCDRCVE